MAKRIELTTGVFLDQDKRYDWCMVVEGEFGTTYHHSFASIEEAKARVGMLFKSETVTKVALCLAVAEFERSNEVVMKGLI